MSIKFVRHSFQVGKYSKFVIYQKPGEFATFLIGQWIAYIIIILPLKIIHFISAAVLKLVLNSIFAFVYWIKGKRDSSTIQENETKLESIYSMVDNIAVIFGYICNIIVIGMIVFAIVSYFKNPGNGKEKSAKMKIEERIETLQEALGTEVEVSSLVEEYIKSNKSLFKEGVTLDTVKGKADAKISLSKYCDNLDFYDGKFLRIKGAMVDRVSTTHGMSVVEVSYDEDKLVRHSVNIYFYGKVKVETGDKVAFYAYPIHHENIFTDEALANQGVENGDYEDYLLGSYIKKKN